MGGSQTLPPGFALTLAVRLATGSEERRLSFVGNAASTLANNSTIDVAANARVRVGRALGIRLVATASRSPVKGALSLTYRASARKLVSRTAARGTVTLGQSAGSAFAVGVTSARVLAAGTQTTVVLTGTVAARNAAHAGPVPPSHFGSSTEIFARRAPSPT